MTSLLIFTLLCPDTVYFGEPFTVRIERSEPAPPGSAPNAWEARSGDAGIVGDGRFLAGADSLTARIDGPGAYFSDGARVSVAIGTFDPSLGAIKDLPGSECMTRIRNRAATVAVRRTRPGTVYKAWHGFRVDGRVF